LAGSGYSCYCSACAAAFPKDINASILDGDNNQPNQTNNLIRYDVFGQVDQSRASGAGPTSTSLDFGQTPSYSYSALSASSTSHSIPSSYASMPAAYSGPSIPLQSPSSCYPGVSHSAGLSIPSQTLAPHPLGFGGSPFNSHKFNMPANESRMQGIAIRGRSRRKPSRPRQPPVVPISRPAGSGKVPNPDVFLKAQEYLELELRYGHTLGNSEKKNLSDLLRMSPVQLEFCIKARQDHLPTLKNLASETTNSGLSPDHVAQWYLQVQSCHTTKNPTNDSAYQSRTNPSSIEHMPNKKRKKNERDDRAPPYQCTYIDQASKYCLRENQNFTDWKRHEEIHCPQKMWECLIQGSDGAVSCHICTGNIDLVGQQSFTTHDRCVGANPRRGHLFPRKDKLISHVKSSHGCEVNIDTWYENIPSDWKKECGFCGLTFTDWDTRCTHVGEHFVAGKRMNPDWKDPWPFGRGVFGQGPGGDDDDEDDEDGEDDNDGNGYHGCETPSNRDPNKGPGEKDGGPSNSHGGNASAGTTSNNQGHRQNNSSNCDVTGDADDGLQEPERQVRSIGNGSPSPHSSRDSDGKGTVDIFESVQKLGYGSFGMVDEVEHCATKIHFARKTIRLSSRRSASALSQAHREVVALRQLKHQHIVNVLASYSSGDHFSIIMFPVAERNLSQFLLDENATTLPQISKLSRWIGCLTSAISYMHEKSWQHLDIKPSNILISGSHVMLADFGGARLMDEPHSKKTVATSYIITPMYCAPEIIYRSTSLVVPGASDIFSLGCVLLEMVTVIHREKLQTFVDFRTYGSDDASYHSSSRKTCFWIEYLSNINQSLGLPHQEWLELITKMLSVDSKKRPTAHELVQSYLLQAHQLKKNPDEEKYLAASSDGYVELLESARLWLEECRTCHRNCPSPEKGFFPSRVLNVRTRRNFVHLQSIVLRPSCQYVTLSHCWGAGTVLTTTSQSFDRMTSGIEISSLPAIFAAAVRITQDLGFEYLWIDALCIIQDSQEDWMIESSKMGEIYSNSSLNISAVDGGIFSQSPGPRLLTYKAALGDSRALCSSCSRNYTAFEPLCQKTTTTMLLDSPLSKRGWALQERILSPRILYFSETSIAWECRSNCSTFDIVSRMRKRLKLLFLQTHLQSEEHKHSPNTLIHVPNDYITIWKDIVRKYSRLKLSFTQDKLPALAGVARKIAEGSGQAYVAGLWKEHLLPTGILWSRDFATVPLIRPQYRAPSWSWASIDSPVIWSKTLPGEKLDPRVEIIDCHVSPLSNISPFGALSGGQLVIRGPMQRVTVTRPGSEQLLKRGRFSSFAFAQWDALDTKPATPQQQAVDPNQRRRLWCLQILKGVGLILIQVKATDSEFFQRVGAFWIQDKCIAESESDCDWDVRTVTIV
jgi:serine/threonine protein kinase